MDAMVLATGAGSPMPSTNAASAYSVDEEWGLSHTEPGSGTLTLKTSSPAEFREALYEAFKRIMGVYGGPIQFLQDRYPRVECLTEYAHELWQRFPPMHDTHIKNDLQSVSEQNRNEATVYKLHPAMLDFREQCTDRELPDADTAIKLADEYLTNSLMTAGDELLVDGSPSRIRRSGIAAPWVKMYDDPENYISAFGIGYEKGARRMSTLHCLLTLCLDDNVDLHVVHPGLARSLSSISCVYLYRATLIDRVFGAFRASVRGSIRKAPNVVSWVMFLNKAKDKGSSDSSALVRRWNSQATKAATIQGPKAQAVKNMLELMCQEERNIVVADISAKGWDNSVWTEEGLACKKMYPGTHFRCQSKKWTARKVVTPHSLRLMLLRSVQRGNMPAKCKLNKAATEAASEMAACVWNIAKEAQEMVPFTEEALENQFFNPWVQGNPAIEFQVQSAITLADPLFTPRDIKAVKQLMDAHTGVNSVQLSLANTEMIVAATALEESTFKQNLAQCKADVAALRNYIATCTAFEHSRYQKKMEWDVGQHKVSEEAAEAFMCKNCLVIVVQDNAQFNQVVNDAFSKFVTLKCSQFSLQREKLLTFSLTNWVAPCMVSNTLQEAQANAVAMLCYQNPCNLNAVLMPQFCYTKGQLHLTEGMCLSMLTNRGLNIDNKFALFFKEKLDVRDRRPLMYDGRLIFGGHVTADNWWFKSALMSGKVEPADQLSQRDMLSVESISPTTLPSTTDIDGTIKGAGKFAQLGEDAMVKLVDAALDGVANRIDGESGLILGELNLSVGHFFDAFLAKKLSATFELFYFGLAESEEHKEWFMKVKGEKLKMLHLSNRLSQPGFPDACAEMPQDLQGRKPDPPIMNKIDLKFADDGTPLPVVPKELVDTWSSHQEYGKEFTSWLTEVLDEFGHHELPAEDNQEADPATKKRKLDADSKKKTQEVNAEKIVSQEPTEGVLKSTKLCGKGQTGAVLKVLTGGKAVITNTLHNELHMPAGSVVAGFGKGDWKLEGRDADINTETMLLYQIQTMDDMVLMGTKYMTVADAIKPRRARNPMVKLMYHTMHSITDGPAGSFSVSLDHKVFFAPDSAGVSAEDNGEEKLQQTIGSLVPRKAWDSHCLSIIWAVKWTANGLSPVRPVVVLTKDVSLLPARTLLMY